MAKKTQYGLGHTRITVPGRPDLTNKTAVVMVGDKTLEEALEGAGTSDYEDLDNLPSINGVELSGNKTSNDIGVYSKPSGGIPESDLSSDVQQALQKHFKGWLTSTSQLPDNPVVGDYAYIEDNGTTYIYRCTTDGEWPSTSTEEKDPADVTFAGGEEVNETYIDDTHLVNPVVGSLAKAEDAKEIKDKFITNEVVDLSTLAQTTKALNSSSAWSSSIGKSVLIPVGENGMLQHGDTITVTANSSQSANIAFLIDPTYKADNKKPNFATGYTSRIVISTNTSQTYIIGNDVVTIYVRMTDTSQNSTVPVITSVKDYTIAEIVDDLTSIDYRLLHEFQYNINEKYIGTNGEELSNDNTKCTDFINVNVGDTFKVSGFINATGILVGGYDENGFVTALVTSGNYYKKDFIIPNGITKIKACSAFLDNFKGELLHLETLFDVSKSLNDRLIYDVGYIADKKYIGTNGEELSNDNTKCTKEIAVHEGDLIKVSGFINETGILVGGYDEDGFVTALVESGDFVNHEVIIPSGITYIKACSAFIPSLTTGRLLIYDTVQNIRDYVNDVEENLQRTKNINQTAIPSCLSKLTKIAAGENAVLNLGMIGDSWTQGVGTDSMDRITYVKYLTRLLWNKYGYAGLGWFDFGYSNSDMKCADDTCISLAKSGTIDYVTRTPSSLGIACSHAVFSNGASYTLELVDNTKPIDNAVIWYYNNAAFTYEVNDSGTAIQVTADSSSGWQSTTINANIAKLKVQATADNTIVFGVDFSYGNKGVKVHKLGNRAATSTDFVEGNADNWISGISKLNLDILTETLFTNDRWIDNAEPSLVVDNIKEIFRRFKQAEPYADVVCVAPSDNYESGSHPYTTQQYANAIYVFCYENNYPFVDLAPLFGSKTQIQNLGMFYDNLHPNQDGALLIGNVLFNQLFNFLKM